MKIRTWMKNILLAIIAFIGVSVASIAIVLFVQTTNPPIVKTADIHLRVGPSPTFTLTTTPSDIYAFLNRPFTFKVQVESVNDFGGDITIEVSGIPIDWTINYFPTQSVTINPADSPKEIQVEVIVPDDASLISDYTITVTATSINYN